MVTTEETVSVLHRFDELEDLLWTAKPGRLACFSDPKIADRVTAAFDRGLEGGRVLSLDVFDTLAVRDNSSEISRFYEIGGRMAEIVTAEGAGPVSQVDAFLARYLGTIASYRAARKVKGCREGELSEIHATASRLLTGTDRFAEAFIEAELDHEATRIHLNPAIVDYVRRYRADGGTVLLLSDMYMNARQIAALLARLGLPEDDYDFLVSSADTKVSKASGKLFPLIEERLERGPADFFHVGDSLRGDYRQPKTRGWGALHLPIAEQDIIERRRDHLATQARLKDAFGVHVDIAIPA